MGSDDIAILKRALQRPSKSAVVAPRIEVTRKGCGHSSGEAPRALKAILLDRLKQASEPGTLKQVSGDSYKTVLDDRPVSFTFRVTTSRLDNRPWFNVSANEVDQWLRDGTSVIVAQCLRSTNTVWMYFIDASWFGDIRQRRTKKAEGVPTALFEIRQVSETDGAMLYNRMSSSNEAAVLIGVENVLRITLTEPEHQFLQDGYKTERIIDRTNGGNIAPLAVLIQPGKAEPEHIAEFLAELSTLYRMVGGSGINFQLADVRQCQGVVA
ncbi:MAG: hypothetical protein KF691_01830 [Phycisphaeraceae bacterium]|nr:hypothetical protein [Phycisphaeraceae bacterium]